jgi:hypothetical protein
MFHYFHAQCDAVYVSRDGSAEEAAGVLLPLLFGLLFESISLY